MITQLEVADRLTRTSGKCAAWFQRADAATRSVAGAANGYLFSVLLRACGHCDPECAELLREGKRLCHTPVHVSQVFGWQVRACWVSCQGAA